MIFNLGGGAAAPQLTSIAVTTKPTKTEYNAGESFDKSGMVVTAYFDDGSSAVVTGYTYSPITVPLGSSNITISYTIGEITKTAVVAVKGKRYLYKSGNAYSDWTSVGKLYASNSSASATAPTITRGSSTITFKSSATSQSGIVYSTNKVSLKDVDTLTVKGTFTSGGSNYLVLYVWSAIGTLSGDNSVASKTILSSNTSVSLDVSSLTGSYYIGFFLRGSTAIISEMYAE